MLDREKPSFITANFLAFQVMSLIGCSPRDFIARKFDFRVLQNLFYYTEEGPVVEITDIRAIVQKVIHIDFQAYFKAVPRADPIIAVQRASKYRERGSRLLGQLHSLGARAENDRELHI